MKNSLINVYCEFAAAGEHNILHIQTLSHPYHSVILLYDYTITFPYEVRLFWQKKATGATVLFFANRYLTLFYYIFVLSTNVSMSDAVSLRDLVII